MYIRGVLLEDAEALLPALPSAPSPYPTANLARHRHGPTFGRKRPPTGILDCDGGAHRGSWEASPAVQAGADA